MKALIIPVEGNPRVTDVPSGLAPLQEAVGGYIEHLSLEPVEGRLPAHGYCNEEGKLDGLLPNPLATLLFRTSGYIGADVIVGPVILLGMKSDGDEADVPGWLVEEVEHLSHMLFL